jgi:hypothetical protein
MTNRFDDFWNETSYFLLVQETLRRRGYGSAAASWQRGKKTKKQYKIVCKATRKMMVQGHSHTLKHVNSLKRVNSEEKSSSR